MTGHADGQMPLEGLRVIDLTMFMSGPLASLLLADLGADVIKVEAIQRLDGWRGSGRSGERPWENAPLFNWINRSKRNITLNLTDPRGAALLEQLASKSDVLLENYTPRVMANFGLDYARLSASNPGLIMLSMPGFGGTGSWRDYTAFAWTTEQLSMICHLTGYEGDAPLFTGTTCGDPLAGLMGAVALLAAVNHRRRTGEGQHIDLSQVEASTAFVADALVAAQLGDEPTRRGNRHPSMSPHGFFRCRDERWLAIACRTDREWAALSSALGRPEPVLHPTLVERLAHESAIEQEIQAWTADQDAHRLMHQLQAAGIPAGVALNGKEILEDAHLMSREFFLAQHRAEIGVKHYPGEPFRFARGRLRLPARTSYLGESNREVLCTMLGVSDAAYDGLERDDVIGDAPLGARTAGS